MIKSNNKTNFPHKALVVILILSITFLLGFGGKRKALHADVKLINKMADDMMRITAGKPPADPKKLKTILEKIFKDNGYSYPATIHYWADRGFNMYDSVEGGLAVFLLWPFIAAEDNKVNINTVFSGQELEDIKKLNKKVQEFGQ